MLDLTPNEYVLVAFVSFWGLVGVGIIAAAAYVWMQERRDAARPHFTPRRRRSSRTPI
jgi:hypothetical protein